MVANKIIPIKELRQRMDEYYRSLEDEAAQDAVAIKRGQAMWKDWQRIANESMQKAFDKVFKEKNNG